MTHVECIWENIKHFIDLRFQDEAKFHRIVMTEHLLCLRHCTYTIFTESSQHESWNSNLGHLTPELTVLEPLGCLYENPQMPKRIKTFPLHYNIILQSLSKFKIIGVIDYVNRISENSIPGLKKLQKTKMISNTIVCLKAVHVV